MQQYQELYPSAGGQPVAQASAQIRSQFLRRVYLHLAGAVALFLVVETILQALPFSRDIAAQMAGGKWLLVIAGFWIVGFVADKWTRPGLPMAQQYLGLSLYAVAWAIMFLPIVAYVRYYQDPNVLPTAGVITLALVVGLSLVALDPRTNFSMLRGALVIFGVVALGLIIASILFGVALGTWFTLAMIVFAGAGILYKTDEITKTANTDSYVSASLALFASVMLLLWYVIRLLSSRR